jgi:hypothetical protein
VPRGFSTRFSGFVFDWNSYSRWTLSCSMMSYITKRITGTVRSK